MQHHGIDINVKHIPALNPGFVPLSAYNRAYAKLATQPFAIAIERENGQVFTLETKIIGDGKHNDADNAYAERMVKLLLWAIGGFRITVCGSDSIAAHIKEQYSPTGKRAFDNAFMARVYERDFEVNSLPYGQRPQTHEVTTALKRDLSGCRIGFDAGGRDREVSAVVDGEAIYSEEVVWHPKITADPMYHFNGIVDAMKTAASKMPRVDAIGVSSAGIYVANRTAVASLFLKVEPDDFERVVKDIYINAAKEIGDVPLVVANDGDVTALAGAMGLGENNVLGIAMGTSLAAGYIDGNGNITGRLNELAFAPVDGQDNAFEDEWSGDIGCGVKCMSQDGVALLCPAAGIELPADATPAEKLTFVQNLMKDDDARAAAIFDSIGVYLGHALALWRTIYPMRHVLLLGRVMSGKGGDIVIEKARQVIKDDYPEIADLNLLLPDEKTRRVGQSAAAAALPSIG